MKVSSEIIDYFFKVQGKCTDRCLEPTEKCKQRAIRSHSIPNATVLAQLESDGHVVMAQMKLRISPPGEVAFKRVGRNHATTFGGLCAQHDCEIFRPIDEAPPEVENPKHLFLMAYRAVLREFHAVLQNAVRFQAVYKKRVEFGISPGDVPCKYGEFALSHLLNACECYQYKRYYDNAYMAGDWAQVKHHVIILKAQRPSVAVSSLFSLDDIDATETPRVSLSLFPSGGDVVVVLSTIPRDTPFVDGYLQRLLRSESYFQRYLLSKLILQHCSNFVIAPSYYDALSQDCKDAICRFFVDTILRNAEDHEDERLYLF
jgi:hypothetical protein